MAKKEIAISSSNLKQYNMDKPADVVKVAAVVKNYILHNKLYTEISGKNYVWVDGWTFSGFLLGLNPQIESVENLSSGKEFKYQATAKIYRGDKIMSVGVALCSNVENRKKSFDEYAILSMAQTRAIGKAYRNLIGFVIKLAGYDTTTAEEMVKAGETPVSHPPEPISKNQKPAELKRGQVIGPDGEPTWVCAKCGDPISDKGADFTMKICGKRLCKEHFDEAKKNK